MLSDLLDRPAVRLMSVASDERLASIYGARTPNTLVKFWSAVLRDGGNHDTAGPVLTRSQALLTARCSILLFLLYGDVETKWVLIITL